jgi:formylglycine-generating enzyme required for sulfatase activity
VTSFTNNSNTRTTVFLSYAHEDREAVDDFLVSLAPFERDRGIERWDDSLIQPGQLWETEIRQALGRTRVAILFVSRRFMASDYIARKELPVLLASEREHGLTIIPVYLEPCGFHHYTELNEFQLANKPESPFYSMNRVAKAQLWTTLTDVVLDILATPAPVQETNAIHDAPARPAQTNIDHCQGVQVGNNNTQIINIHPPSELVEDPLLRRRYLESVVRRVGELQIPLLEHSVKLETVYIDGPVDLKLDLNVDGEDWWFRSDVIEPVAELPTSKPARGTARPEASKSGRQVFEEAARRWVDLAKPGNGDHDVPLTISIVAAATPRLVVLGGPGSGKSAFVRFLALCLAEANLDGSSRTSLTDLDLWPHGPMTPIYVELRRYINASSLAADNETLPDAAHLMRYLACDGLDEGVRDNAQYLERALQNGTAVLILDGLDEVPFEDGRLTARRKQLQALAESLTLNFPNARCVVTSRPYAYESWTLPGFMAVRLVDFEEEQRVDLLRKLFAAAGQPNANQATSVLSDEMSNLDPELTGRPLFLTMFASVAIESGKLPSHKGALYDACIRQLLRRWTLDKRDRNSLAQLMGGASLDSVYDRLSELAYDALDQLGTADGAPEIPVGLVYSRLSPLGLTRAAQILRYLSENAGVLVSPGQDAQRDVFQFAHRSFQEYLAARRIVALCKEHAQDGLVSYVLLRDLVMRSPNTWREPGRLAADILRENDTLAVWSMLADLLGRTPYSSIDNAADAWWPLWLAAQIVEDQKLLVVPGAKLQGWLQVAVCDALRNAIVELVATPAALPPLDRATCGRVLSALGDPRPGIGLIQIGEHAGLPDISWRDVPQGEFLFGSDEHEDERPFGVVSITRAFRISRYLVTHAQFQSFINDPGGYVNPRWRVGPQKGVIGWQSAAYLPTERPYDNHPRERVSWYEAMAFCSWLTDRLGYEITLPTEEQWERAARGTDGLIYPYGNDYDPTRANSRETGISQTTAVGIYPNGASPCGAMDMSGNVWEWTLNEYRSRKSDTPESGIRRVLRGGTWYQNPLNARAAYRFSYSPDERHDFFGFRLVSPALDT